MKFVFDDEKAAQAAAYLLNLVADDLAMVHEGVPPGRFAFLIEDQAVGRIGDKDQRRPTARRRVGDAHVVHSGREPEL